jgi:hypothetical protein
MLFSFSLYVLEFNRTMTDYYDDYDDFSLCGKGSKKQNGERKNPKTSKSCYSSKHVRAKEALLSK